MIKRVVAAGVFVHNEQECLPKLLSDLEAQVFPPDLRVDFSILCNGCTDRSFEVAQSEVQRWPTRDYRTASALNLEEGGKANTWNAFVEHALNAGASAMVFVDGDIRILDPKAIATLLESLDSPDVSIVVSQPQPVFAEKCSRLVRLSFSVGQTPHRDGSICGQLYAATAGALSDIRLPKLCLVEDGFLAACVKTSLFTSARGTQSIAASRKVSHQYTPYTTFGELYEHSIRLALGTEMNAAYFTPLWHARDRQDRIRLLRRFSRGEQLEETFRAHAGLPQNSAISTRKSVLKFVNSVRRDGWKGIARIPLSGAKLCYTQFVNAGARRRFRSREFKW
ncbi:glycosyltransferase family 2 protein [Aeoliella sp. ICT_H6.2]|uniref:Glycosyltransferase family 2 protein n=1 Tax=Aeoliella straminimaris TaxID=2954799 RepID=A0A9X2JI67_9BACT|nr:glycosyltransferase family A protein [Aeoliella straminimaris]MCO6045358.1 glycosyltransferase family 2 protein [Aeoliella straminimaris]